jgi:predicted TIM-barrel fold metal-dependent hydrolase
MRSWEAWLAQHQETALDPEQPLIDPHHHLWDRGGHTYLAPQFRADHGAHRVQATVYVECLASYDESAPEHLKSVGETVAARAQFDANAGSDCAVCAGIVSRVDLVLEPALLAKALDAHERAGRGAFRGVRYLTAWDASIASRHHATCPGMLLEPAVQRGAAMLAELGLSLDLYVHHPQLGEVAELARAVPSLSVVLEHCGGPLGTVAVSGEGMPTRTERWREWADALTPLGALPNVHLKFGGLAMPVAGFGLRERAAPPSSEEIVRLWQPYFNHCVTVFGPERCMFESNFPVDRVGCSYGVLWNAFKRLVAQRGDVERRAMLAGTARQVYRL